MEKSNPEKLLLLFFNLFRLLVMILKRTLFKSHHHSFVTIKEDPDNGCKFYKHHHFIASTCLMPLMIFFGVSTCSSTRRMASAG